MTLSYTPPPPPLLPMAAEKFVSVNIMNRRSWKYPRNLTGHSYRFLLYGSYITLVATGCKAWVCGRWLAGITGSNSSLVSVVFCQVEDSATGRAWCICGMILTGENRSTRRKTCPGATLSTINLTWTGPKPDLCVERPVTNHVIYGMALKTEMMREHCASIRNISWWLVFGETVADYCKKHVNRLWGQTA
jgi:hypothetical protein